MQPQLSNPHQLAEERSIAYHRALASKIESDPAILDMAQCRVEGWIRDRSVHPFYAEGWRELLDLPLGDLQRKLVDPSQEMRDMRQCTPFAGGLDPRERWEIWRRVGEELRDELRIAS